MQFILQALYYAASLSLAECDLLESAAGARAKTAEYRVFAALAEESNKFTLSEERLNHMATALARERLERVAFAIIRRFIADDLALIAK